MQAIDRATALHYIRYMPNMSKITLSAGHWQFIEELATLLHPWGMQPGVARLYGLLLLLEEPISLDAICDALEISKSTASVTARHLERSKLVRRHTVKGSKRILYAVAKDSTATVSDQAAMLGNFAALLTRAKGEADSEVVGDRLASTAAFCRTMQQVMRDAIEQFEKP